MPLSVVDALPSLLRRGAVAGFAGGLTCGVFGLALARPVLDRAVRLEHARGGSEPGAEIVSRSTQHAGLVVAAVATGIALGILFAIAYAVIHRSEPADSWARSVQLGAWAAFAVSVIPFLRYPPDPPGVGDAATVGVRTQDWLAALAIGILGTLAAARLGADLRRRPVRASHRHLAVGGVLLLTAAAPFLLPSVPDALAAPADLVWEFRLLGLAGSLLLWGVLSAVFGLLGERAAASETAARDRTAAARAAPAPTT